jgi:glycine cleavage system aminomethyltransferase T
MASPAAAQALVEHLAESGARLAGRDAWDMARVEAGIAAMHPDLDGGLTPGEAGLDRLFNVAGGGGDRRMVGLIFGDEATVHAPGTPLEREGQVVGTLRSCVPGPTIGSIIALAVVEQHHATAGARVTVADDTATIVTLPFLRRRTNE